VCQAPRASTLRGGLLWCTTGIILGACGVLLVLMLRTPSIPEDKLILPGVDGEFLRVSKMLDKATAELKKSEAAYQEKDALLRKADDELARLKPLPEEKERLTKARDEAKKELGKAEDRLDFLRESEKAAIAARDKAEQDARDIGAKVNRLEVSLKTEMDNVARIKKSFEFEHDRFVKSLGQLDEARGKLERAILQKENAEAKLRELERKSGKLIPGNDQFNVRPIVVTPPSGVKYMERVVGEGRPVQVGDVVSVLYTGALEDGKVFDTKIDRADPRIIQIGAGELNVKGLEDGIVGMKLNGKRTITIPWERAFGAKGREGIVPGFANVTYELELIDLKKGNFDGVNRIPNSGPAPLNVKRFATLKLTDFKDPIRARPSKVFEVRLEAGKLYNIETSNAKFDTFLRLVDSRGNELAADDDGGEGLHSLIEYRPKVTAFYRIYCTGYRTDGQGAFTLHIRQR